MMERNQIMVISIRVRTHKKSLFEATLYSTVIFEKFI